MAQKKKKAKRSKASKASSKAGSKPSVKAPRVSGWDGLSDTVQHSICLALLLAVALGFFAPALFTGKTLVGGDTIQWRATAQTMLEHRETTGEEPLWATNVFGGMPGHVISPPPKVPQIDFLANWLRGFAWPASHFIFLLLGAYLLVFYLTKDKLSSVLAACAYGLTTYLPIILVAGHNTKFIALCYAPWLVLAFVHALRKPGLLAGLLFALALAINLRANHVQITYYLTFMLGIWWIVEGVGAVRKGEAKSFGLATGWMALGALLALMMVAQIYLPNYEYKAFSIRGASSGGVTGEGGLDWAYAMSWSQGVGELATLLIAEAFGGAALYWGPKPPTGGPHYVGGIVLLLAGLALWRYRRQAVWALGIGVFWMILFSLGRHFELLNRLMYDYFPLFDAFRVPETWLSAVALVLAVLAGMGLFYVVRSEPSKEAEQQKTKAVYITVGVLVGVTLVLFLGKNAFFSFERPGEFEQVKRAIAAQAQRPADDPQVIAAADQYIQEQYIPPRTEVFNADALRTLFVLLLAAGALALFRLEKIPGWTMQAALVVLVIIDLGGVGRRYFNEDRVTPARDAKALIQTFDVDRFILQKRDEAGGNGHFRVLSLERVDQTKNARPSYHHESLGGYSGAKLRLYQDYLENLLTDPATGLPNENALDLLNTRYIITQQPVPGAREVYRGEQTGFAVMENPDAVPRAFLVGKTEVIASAEETWARLRSPTFDPRRTAILPEPLDAATTPLDSSSTASATLQRYGPREIAWTVETDAPRLLVVSEIYYPAGWNAYIDGESAPIYRADYLLRAVPVPAGAHEVVMRFEPSSYSIGNWLSGLSTLLVYGGLLALLGLAWHRKRGRGEGGKEPEGDMNNE